MSIFSCGEPTEGEENSDHTEEGMTEEEIEEAEGIVDAINTL